MHSQVGMQAWLAGVGRRVRGSGGDVRTTLDFVGRTLQSLGRFARGRSAMRWSDLAWQLEQTGPRSLPIVALVSFLVGLIVAYMGAAQLERFGAQTFVADLVTVGVVREIAALLVGIVLAGRVGAAFAAQIGSMRANEEIDALQTLGLDPVDHLVLPRVLALLAVGPLLTAFAAVVGIGVGWLVAVGLYDVAPLDYLHKSVEALTLPHVLIGLLKGTVYALLVALAGCRQGLAAGRSAQAVGDATTAAVVQSIVWMVVAASTLTVIFQRLDL
jgi:phospholipid/cholesterol/gamma-HCH transport system permease protein